MSAMEIITTQEKFQYVENKMEKESIGYYILDYTDSYSMPDDKSKQLFDDAHKALNKFVQYIEEQANLEDPEITKEG